MLAAGAKRRREDGTEDEEPSKDLLPKPSASGRPRLSRSPPEPEIRTSCSGTDAASASADGGRVPAQLSALAGNNTSLLPANWHEWQEAALLSGMDVSSLMSGTGAGPDVTQNVVLMTPASGLGNGLVPGLASGIIPGGGRQRAPPKKREGKKVSVKWTPEEEANLVNGVQLLGRHWTKILQAFPFDSTRTSVELKDKYRNMLCRQHATDTPAFNNQTVIVLQQPFPAAANSTAASPAGVAASLAAHPYFANPAIAAQLAAYAATGSMQVWAPGQPGMVATNPLVTATDDAASSSANAVVPPMSLAGITPDSNCGAEGVEDIDVDGGAKPASRAPVRVVYSDKGP